VRRRGEGADVADVDSGLMWRPHNTEVMLAEHREEEGADVANDVDLFGSTRTRFEIWT
jgi:hypothetical protein